MKATIEGWILLDVPARWIDEAHEQRVSRDRSRRTFFEGEVDLRAGGDIGEMGVNEWLTSAALGNFEWLRDTPDGEPDFILHGRKIEVKTLGRTVPFRRGYSHLVFHEQIDDPADFFFFCSYQRTARKLWLCGGITCEMFRAESVFKRKGEWLGKFHVKQDSYHISDRFITPPWHWLDHLRSNSR